MRWLCLLAFGGFGVLLLWLSVLQYREIRASLPPATPVAEQEGPAPPVKEPRTWDEWFEVYQNALVPGGFGFVGIFLGLGAFFTLTDRSPRPRL